MASALDPGAILAQLTANFMKLPLSQKIFLPVIIIGSIWGIVYVAQWATRPDYSVLYSDLEPADAAAVVEYLKSHNIKYQVRGKGDIIAVSPPELVQETRLALASEGIPKGGTVGFELFDSTSFVATGFVEKLKFIRAVQGELERTIASLDSVVAARVHVAQPDKTVFARKQNKPTASVLLKLKPGGELTKKQIKGIANLVAGSIEGLSPEDVTIVDTHGNPLSDRIKKKEEPFGADATQIQYQHAVEEAYVKRIESMLAKVLGPDKVIARVTADLDFSMVEKQEESYDPGGQVARSEKTIEERVGTEEKGGIPGVVSNLTANPEAAGINQSQGNVKRRESVSNYEVSKAVSKVVLPQGSLKRLSVAVLVDGNYVAPPGAKEGAEPEYKPLSQEVMDQIEEVVKSAVGFDAARGDTITVQNIPFRIQKDDFSDELDKIAQQDMIFKAVSKIVPIIFVLLLFFVVVRPLVKFVVTPTEAELDLTRLLPTGIEELEEEIKQENMVSIPVVESPVDIEQLELLIAENSKIVKENPSQAALLLRYWLNDGRFA